MKYSIVPIEEQHIPGYNAALDNVARERLYIGFLERPPLAYSEAFVRENIQKNHPHYVALVDGSVVGWCDITPMHRPVFAHIGVLGMGIMANYRGHGIGRALMQAALDKAKANGLTRIELEVRKANGRAIALYEQFGFTVEGVKRNATRIDGVYSDDVIMGMLF